MVYRNVGHPKRSPVYMDSKLLFAVKMCKMWLSKASLNSLHRATGAANHSSGLCRGLILGLLGNRCKKIWTLRQMFTNWDV